MTQIQIDDVLVDVIRSKRRKTLALAVRDARVTVRMPEKLPLKHAEDFVIQKQRWIKQKLATQNPPVQLAFSTGESLLFLGQPVILNVMDDAAANGIELTEDQLKLELKESSPAYTRRERWIRNWYQQQAERYLQTRSKALIDSTGLQPRSVTIKSYKARWGSCRLNGDIQLNWKLIMAPPAVIDYVIIHELCHLRQHNHSPAFWELVSCFTPDYKTLRQWLKDHGSKLSL